MENRNVEFPVRYRMVKVAGTEDLVDLFPVPGNVYAEGTPFVKDTMLSDATATLLDLPASAVPNDALVALKHLTEIANPLKIYSQETAGSYTWVVPDLNDGKDYYIGVFIIGAGGSGCALRWIYNYDYTPNGCGGASGFTQCFVIKVTPGQSYQLVVGKGGASVSVTSAEHANGEKGGESSFNGVIADGGDGGKYYRLDTDISGSIAYGSMCTGGGNRAIGQQFGGYPLTAEVKGAFTTDFIRMLPLANQCFNPFERKRILAPGGSADTNKTAPAGYAAGKDPVTGLGGGDGAVDGANDATAPGCGGGASSSISAAVTSGKGADGAVYLYYLGGRA